MVHNHQIEYKNVTLRPLEKGDIENLRLWRNDSNNSRYLNPMPYISPEIQMMWFERYLNNNDEMCFAIIENRELNRLVGSLSLYGFNNDSCFFGKILVGDVEAHGRKIGVNASKAALQIAFEQLRLKRVNLYVYTDNLVALNVYERAGFVVIEEHYAQNGKKEYTMIKQWGDSNA